MTTPFSNYTLTARAWHELTAAEQAEWIETQARVNVPQQTNPYQPAEAQDDILSQYEVSKGCEIDPFILGTEWSPEEVAQIKQQAIAPLRINRIHLVETGPITKDEIMATIRNIARGE